jgi:hypothetical protein
MAFLDRFIYREAKKSTASRGSSMMQPGLANQDRSNRVVLVKGAYCTTVGCQCERRGTCVRMTPVSHQEPQRVIRQSRRPRPSSPRRTATRTRWTLTTVVSVTRSMRTPSVLHDSRVPVREEGNLCTDDAGQSSRTAESDPTTARGCQGGPGQARREGPRLARDGRLRRS